MRREGYGGNVAVNGYRDIPPSFIGKSYFEISEQLLIYFKSKDTFLSTILENEQMNIIIWTLDDTVVWLNKYAWLMVGFTEDNLNEIININSIIPQDMVCHIKERLSSMEDTKMQYRYGSPLVSKCGMKVYISWHNYIICDDRGKKYIVSTGIDETNFKNAEKQLEGANNDLIAANEELAGRIICHE